jgi:hypothetical protein
MVPGLLLLLAAPMARSQSTYFQEVESLNPIAYWPLQETVQPPQAYVETNIGSLGAVANMYYAATSVADITSTAGAIPGDPDAAMLFAGNSSSFGIVPTTDHRVSLPTAKSFTVETWAYATAQSQYVGLVSQTGPINAGGLNAAPYKAGWALNQDYVPFEDNGGSGSGALYGWSFNVFNGQGSFSGAQALAPYQFALNTWYYVVGVFDGTNAIVYVNGNQVSSAATSTPMAGAFVPDTWDPIQFAGSRGFGGNPYHGALDEVAIYTNALSASQISNHYNAATNGAGQYSSTVQGDGPTMYWRMDAPAYTSPTPAAFPVAANYGSLASTTTNLTIGNSDTNAVYQPGTLPGVAGAPYAGFGSPSYACAFNGITGAVDAGYNPALDPTGTATPFTVVGWFMSNPTDNSSRWNTLVSHSDKSWRFKIQNGTTHWNYGGSTANDLIGPSINVNDGNWHMFAGVWNPTNSMLYIDAAVSATVATNKSITGAPTNDVFIGGAPDYLNPTNSTGANYNTSQQYFAGRLAHIAYFNTALSGAQIESLYSAAEPPPNILVQPVSVARVLAGGTTNIFTVAISGSANLAYQWYFTNAGSTVALTDDSVHITGSASSTLTITNLIDTESGGYYVVASDSYGSVTSSVAAMQVSSQPVITNQTGSGTLLMFVGQSYTLSVAAVGSGPLTYQWYTNGVADTTAGTGPAYPLTNVQLIMSGETFQCVVSNASSTANSAVTTLVVNNLPASVANNSYAQQVLALNPAGYWPMHEVAAPAQGDVETNLGSLGSLGAAYYGDWDINFSNPSNIAVITHNEPGAIAGDSDTSVGFNKAPGSYMIVPHISPLATIKPPFTLETWAKPVDNHSYAVLFGQGGSTGLNGSANLGGFALQWSGTTNSFSLVLWNGSGSGSDELKTTSVYPEGQWYHIVATYDGTNILLYINGQTPSIASGTTNASMNPDSWSPLCIGAGRWGASGATEPYAGDLDEVAIYTNVLTPSDIVKHYNDGLGGGAGVYKADVLADNPLLYYRMDSPTYTKPPRSSWPVLTNYGTVAMNGVYTPGTVPGSLTIPVTGISGSNAPALNGMGAYADAGIAPALDPLGYTSFSYMAYFRGYPSDDRGYEDIMSANDSTWRCSINSAGKIQAHGNSDLTSPTALNDGNWHQFVLTAQANAAATNYTNLLYIDGFLVTSNTAAGTNNPANSPGPEVLIGNEYGFDITNLSTDPAGERCLSGSVCEAAFFNGTVLPASAIQTLYNAVGIAPFFTKQPISTNLNAGVDFTNNVAVAGSAPFSFQWYANGAPVSGQTTSNLTLNPVLPTSGSSDYYVVATSAYGSATSSVVSLSVNTQPGITNQTPAPGSFTVYAGVNFPFSVVAAGARPLSYSWYSNSVVIAGATNSSYTTGSLQPGNDIFYAVVSNSLGTATSADWTITVLAPPSTPYAQSVLSLNPFGYWRMNEPDNGQGDGNAGVICHDYVAGNDGIYTNTLLGEPGYNSADSSYPTYDPETSAGFGSVASNSCAFNISNVDVSCGPGTNAEFTVEAWANGLGQTGNTPGVVGKGVYYDEEFTIDTGASGEKYRFEVRSFAGTAYNANSTLIANDGLWHHLVGVCDEAHSNIWLYIDGTNAANAAIPAGAGIQASNAAMPMSIGARTSAGTAYDEQFLGYINDVAIYKYALSSNQITSNYLASGVAPMITQQPVSSTNINDDSTLVVPAAAIGTSPVSFQWIDNNTGQPVPGATNATLVINNLTASDSYYLQVANSYGTVNSQSVSVNVVQGAPVIEQDITPSAATALGGSSVTFSVGVDGTVPFTYGWQLNGVAVTNNGRISGANSNVLTIASVQAADAGTYQLFVTNSQGNNHSSQATLTVAPILGFNDNGSGWFAQGSTLSWMGNNVLQLTDDAGSEDSATFYDSPVYVGGFEASFTYQVVTGPTSSADGATFCIQNDPRGTAAIGAGGGGLGVGTTTPISPSVELEFNIYSGNGVGGVGVSFDQAGTIGPAISTTPLVINSGDDINALVTYQSGAATVTLTDATAGTQFATSTNVNIPAVLGTNIAYVGFTGSDGGSKSTQQVSNFNFISLWPALTARVTGGNLLLSWPSAIGGYVLQETPVLGSSAEWTTVSATPTVVNGQNEISVPVSGTPAFYRLVLQVPGSF